MERVIRALERNKSEHLTILKQYVRLPSFSNDYSETPKCAGFIQKVMTESGLSTQLLPTDGQPLVYGEAKSAKPDAMTILFYGHYDVQPVEPLDAWNTPPFEPVEIEGRLYGRGTADNKGQHLGHILAIRTLMKEIGDLPVHVKVLLEGEEENGSPNLKEAVRKYKTLLQSDMVIISDGSIHDSWAPRISYGNRGILSFRIAVETASTDNHSGNKGGVIPNAGWELVRLLDSMIDQEDHVLIDGFYDDIEPASTYEERILAKIPYDSQRLARVFGVERIELDNKTYFRNLMFRPTLTINSFLCGEPGGKKSIIPSKAEAKLDARLVVNQSCDEVYERIQKHIHSFSTRGKITLERLGRGMLPAKSNPEFPPFQCVIDAASQAFGIDAIEVPITGGSLPNYVWSDVLQVPFILVPYGNPDERNHAPNENLSLDCYYKGIETTARIILALGQLAR